MESKPPEAAEFRDTQRRQWNSAATGWRSWSEMIDWAASGVSDRLRRPAQLDLLLKQPIARRPILR